MKRYMNYGGRSFAAGGAMPMKQLTEFNEGGRHEENSLGGIPQGMNPQGQMNLVEEGETKFDAENYIYSDSLKVDKELAKAFNLSPKMVGKTFADASKMAGRKKSKREGDAIEEAANNADLENLMEAQEAFKQARIEEKLQEIAELDPEALPALMGQGQDPNMMQDPAMGGQMQEAPMDEQAMMEQQMMAEQQAGGGQPSPEEMAMMQQQQDMMMGQQEGMMRAGGKLPKEVLKARVQSHMSPAEANAYVKNYAGGGYMTRSYAPGGFMGMNMANAGMMTPGPCAPEDCGTPGCPPCISEPTPTEMTTINVARPEISQLDLRGAEGAKERNAAKLAEYQKQVRDRNSLVSNEQNRLRVIAKKQNLLKQYGKDDYDPAAMSKQFAADPNMVKVSPESLKEFNRRNRGESGLEAPEVTELYRPKIGRHNRMAYKDDQAFIDENFNRKKGIAVEYGPVYQTDFGDATEKTFAEIAYPNMESEGLDLIMPTMPSSQINSLVGTEPAPEFIEPQGPGRIEYVKGQKSKKIGTAKQRRQNLYDRIVGNSELKSGKIEGQKGYFTNLGEKRKYNKASKLAKAYVDSGYDDAFIADRSNIIKANADKKEMLKEEKRDFINAAFRNPGQGGLAAARGVGKEIRQLSNAQKYANDPMSSKYEYFTPEVMKNYKASINKFGGNLMQSGQEAGLNPMQGMNQFFNMGGILGGGLAQQNLNLNQGLASQMRRGGKMCYGCGGAMHNFGGRMSNMNQMATGGEIVAGIGSGLYGLGEGLLDTLTFGLTDELTDRGYEALQEIGPMKGEDNIGDAIRGGANTVGAAGGAVLTGGAATGSAVAQGSKGTGDMLGAIGEETGNETLGKVGKGVEGAGQVAGMFIGGGGAGSAAGNAAGAGAGTLGAGAKVASAADAATKASKAAKFAKVGEIASNKAVQAGTDIATAAIGSAEEKAEAERLAEEERMRIEREMMMTNDPNSPYYNPQTELPPLTLGQGGYTGTRSYGKGGGLWANIHAKRARIAAGSGETMRRPGSKGAPTAKALKNSQNAMGGRMYYPGGFLETKPSFNTENDEFNNVYPDISEALDQSIPQQIAMYAPIAKNLYDATLAKSDDYTPDFVPAEFVQLDSAQAIQQAKQSNAGIVNAARAKGFVNPSTMLALNQQLQGTVANVQAQYDQVNAKLKQAKLDKDNTQKTELSKIKQELAMRLKEAKNAAANEALIQAKQIAENKTANKLAALYATMGAPDMGKNFMGNTKMTKAQIDKAIRKLEQERKKLENN